MGMLEHKVKRDLREIFDKIAQSYAYTRLKPWNIVLNVINKKTKVLGDMGCGPGQNIQYILKNAVWVRVIGVDISRQMLLITMKRLKRRKLYERTDLVEADLEFLPFRNSVFDSLIYIASIHHLPSKKARLNAVLEAKRVLKKRGKVLITVWSLLQKRFIKTVFKNMFLKILGKRKSLGDVFIPWKHKGVAYFRYYHLFTPWELKSLIRSSGLVILGFGGLRVKSKLLPENYFALGCKCR